MVLFQIVPDTLTPDDLKTLFPPDPTKWVATYDPRLQGAVVVESHSSEVKVGDLISIDNTDITYDF